MKFDVPGMSQLSRFHIESYFQFGYFAERDSNLIAAFVVNFVHKFPLRNEFNILFVRQECVHVEASNPLPGTKHQA
jgi:hypothetical protein